MSLMTLAHQFSNDGARYDLVVDWYYGIELMAVTTGPIAAAAIAHELCDEGDEIALERYGEISAAPTGAGGEQYGVF